MARSYIGTCLKEAENQTRTLIWGFLAHFYPFLGFYNRSAFISCGFEYGYFLNTPMVTTVGGVTVAAVNAENISDLEA